jgi:hypothetical protein
LCFTYAAFAAYTIHIPMYIFPLDPVVTLTSSLLVLLESLFLPTSPFQMRYYHHSCGSATLSIDELSITPDADGAGSSGLVMIRDDVKWMQIIRGHLSH